MTISSVDGGSAAAIAAINGSVSNERQAGVEQVRERSAIEPNQVEPKKVGPPEAESLSVADIQAAAADLSEFLSTKSRGLNIQVDRDLRQPVVTVLDTDTDQVVRQIPSEKLVALAKFAQGQQAQTEQFREALTGLLLSEET